MISPTKLPFFTIIFIIAQIRAAINVILVEHYDQFTKVLTAMPKVSLMINAIKLTLG